MKTAAGNRSLRENAEESEADQAGEADLPALDEAGVGAGRLAVSKVRLIGKSPGPSQDQKKPAGQ
jgi:hypothetical protein